MAGVEARLLYKNPPILDDQEALASVSHVVTGRLGCAAPARPVSASPGSSAGIFGLGGPTGGPATQQGEAHGKQKEN